MGSKGQQQISKTADTYLMLRKQERSSGVLAPLGAATSDDSQLQQEWNGMKYLGGATGFQHQLGWKHEQAGL